MVKKQGLFVAVLGLVALGLFSVVRAEEKAGHEHGKKGPNGGGLVEVGDADDHHLEVVHDDKAGKLTVYCLLADQKTPYTPKEALKLNLKTKDGNKQFTLKGADSKWEVSDDVLKEEPNGRIVVILPDGKKYNVALAEDEHKK